MKIKFFTLLATLSVHCVSLTAERHSRNDWELLADEATAGAAAPVPLHDDIGSDPRPGRHAAGAFHHFDTRSDGLNFETERPISVGLQPQMPVASEVTGEAANGAAATTGAASENHVVVYCITSVAASPSPIRSVSTPTKLLQQSEDPSEGDQMAQTMSCHANSTNPVGPDTVIQSLSKVVIQPLAKPTQSEPSATHSAHHHLAGTQSLPEETATAPSESSQGSRIWVSTAVWVAVIITGWLTAQGI
ncbi:uncharacterized protein DNG_02631 [Cephalotrichum gorgonifer]|uniref:Uncharacterized protein n=1 Tax=Cephalotrichum gorgonifer TaxID=2041049 RepID=A0AAE8MST1_9PEZI|nr:uncharacterized protein DNG_02631 [Cephalotrichum gorgonifer]